MRFAMWLIPDCAAADGDEPPSTFGRCLTNLSRAWADASQEQRNRLPRVEMEAVWVKKREGYGKSATTGVPAIIRCLM